jgi:hypothetical protein
MDPDRGALGKPHPGAGEDGVDICDALARSLCVRNIDRASDAVDLNGSPLVVTTASPESSHLVEVTCPECYGSGITHCCDGLRAQAEGMPILLGSDGT